MLLTKKERPVLSDASAGESAAARRGLYQPNGIPWLLPVQYGASTLHELACSPQTIQRVCDALEHLESDDYLEFMLGWYASGQKTFGANWRYIDLLTILQATAQALQPRNYLEIGVRRGRSLAVVAAAAPACDLFGFDLWMQDYAGMPNPGPDFVRSELQKLNHRGHLELISGDSHQTVPDFFQQHPGLEFDLITVDGDHSEAGARLDLETVIPHLSVGGVLVMDDITHPQHRYLERIWDDLLGDKAKYSCGKFGELGYGVAWAVRKE